MSSRDEDLERLARMAGMDEGFIALAVHALLEKILREEVGVPYTSGVHHAKTNEASELLRDFLQKKSSPAARRNKAEGDSSLIRDFVYSRSWIAAVRHDFARLETWKYLKTLDLFENFARLCKPFSSFAVLSDAMERLRDLSSDQQRRRGEEFEKLRKENDELQGLIADQDARMEDYLSLANHLHEAFWERNVLREQIEAAEAIIGLEQAEREKNEPRCVSVYGSPKALKERLEDLRVKVVQHEENLHRSQHELESYRDIPYFALSEGMSSFTRTQVRYFETRMEPSHEQREAVRLIADAPSGFLIKGSAGSGKSFVLALALKQYLEAFAPELQKRGETVPLLAYSRTLDRYNKSLITNQDWYAKYSRYVILASTDDFLLDLGKRLFPDKTVSYQTTDGSPIFESLLQEFAPTFWKGDPSNFRDELALVWNESLNEKEHLNSGRTRRVRRMSSERRRVFWEQKQKVEERLKVEPVWPGPYFFYRLSQNEFSQVYPYIFVDEVQDLDRTRLMILRRLTRRGLIMAGDIEQTICRSDDLFHESLFESPPHFVALKQTFRNTQAILEFSESFLNRPDKKRRLETFSSRQGPPPSLILASKNKMAHAAQLQVRIVLEQLGYAPENLLVVTNEKSSLLEDLKNLLRKKGLDLVDVTDPGFDFCASPGIRFSDFSSAKGLSFPVVLVLLDKTPGHCPRPYDQDALESGDAPCSQERRLLYVAFTRATERLVVLVNKDSSSREIGRVKDLARIKP